MLFDDVEWWKVKDENIGEIKYKAGVGLQSQPDIGPSYFVRWWKDATKQNKGDSDMKSEGFEQIKTKKELLTEGVEEKLIDYRDVLNELITSGKDIFLTLGGREVSCKRAFISNPNGYDKVFLLDMNGDVVDHFVLMEE